MKKKKNKREGKKQNKKKKKNRGTQRKKEKRKGRNRRERDKKEEKTKNDRKGKEKEPPASKATLPSAQPSRWEEEPAAPAPTRTDAVMSHRKSASTSFLILLFLCVPPPLFYKWTMESELIHSPLFVVSNSVCPNQNGWAGSGPIQKKHLLDWYFPNTFLGRYRLNPCLGLMSA